MKFRRQFILKIKERRGAVSIIVAIMVFFVLIGISALAIDVGYLYATRNELQNIADGAALAAAGELGDQLSKGETLNVTDIRVAAKGVVTGVQRNIAGGKDIIIKDDDIIIFNIDQAGGNLKSDSNFYTLPDAVRVIARRDGQANNSVRTFFGVVFGVDSVGVNADATAALLPPLQMEPIPVGVPKYWFDESHWPGGFCDQDIKFHPTSVKKGDLTGCAGWHTYIPIKGSPASANKLKTILEDLRKDEYEIPETIAGKTKYAFIGGTVASAFDEMWELFDEKRGNCDDNTDNWCAAVVVYDWDDCSNPNKDITIVGFAPVVITDVLGPPQKTIEGRVLCEEVVWAQGESGEYYGYLTGIPRLVE
jgi:hypothetical protein